MKIAAGSFSHALALTRAFTLALVLLSFGTSAAQQASEDVGSKLPPDVRALLIQEMAAVLAATQNIVAAMVRGDDAGVAREAQAIHDSFILEQQLTEAQHHALHDAASSGFLEKDEAFHALSAELASAARAGDANRQQAVFEQMLNACMECHRQHAAERFPGLQQ